MKPELKSAEEWYAEGGLNSDAAEIEHRKAIQRNAIEFARWQALTEAADVSSKEFEKVENDFSTAGYCIANRILNLLDTKEKE